MIAASHPRLSMVRHLHRLGHRVGRARVVRLMRRMDNVFVGRLWRSLKYECVYLHAFETGPALQGGLARWVSHYNTHRPHSALAGRTPDEAYRGVLPTLLPGYARAAASELKAAA